MTVADKGVSDTSSSIALPEQEAMMDRIESRLELPADAHGLTEYARYYAWDDGRVVAVYIAAGRDVRAGERHWLADNRDLPMHLDGGCDVISVVYDLETQSVEQSLCNGVA